ncbi:hypothetical protein ACLOJK_018069 [Asimina triloba]
MSRLNNRKAKLARAAREARAPSEGESSFPDKVCGSSRGPLYDSAESAGEDFYIPLTAFGGSNQSQSKFGGMTARSVTGDASEMSPTDVAEFAAQKGIQMNYTALRYIRREPGRCEPGQFVSLVDGDRKEVGRGKVFQVEGRWHGKCLEDAGIYVVDVLELKVERWSRLPHPLEAAGMTFDEAESKSGSMRVAWDTNKILTMPKAIPQLDCHKHFNIRLNSRIESDDLWSIALGSRTPGEGMFGLTFEIQEALASPLLAECLVPFLAVCKKFLRLFAPVHEWMEVAAGPVEQKMQCFLIHAI